MAVSKSNGRRHTQHDLSIEIPASTANLCRRNLFPRNLLPAMQPGMGPRQNGSTSMPLGSARTTSAILNFRGLAPHSAAAGGPVSLDPQQGRLANPTIAKILSVARENAPDAGKNPASVRVLAPPIGTLHRSLLSNLPDSIRQDESHGPRKALRPEMNPTSPGLRGRPFWFGWSSAAWRRSGTRPETLGQIALRPKCRTGRAQTIPTEILWLQIRRTEALGSKGWSAAICGQRLGRTAQALGEICSRRRGQAIKPKTVRGKTVRVQIRWSEALGFERRGIKGRLRKIVCGEDERQTVERKAVDCAIFENW